MLSLEGKQLGNYDVIRRIRVGGMGAVYEGRQRTAFDRRVAIKVILGDYAKDKDMRRRFAREARTIARLHHPHILPLIEFGDEQGILYLVMPFIDGGTLTSYLRRSLPDLGEVSAMYQQLLDAVEYAHENGLIHRDIKSSNVLLELRRNAAPYVYLADFGLVRTMRQNDPSQAGKPIPLEQVPGTPHYMAPEQTRGIVTPLTDIYALGVLLFQMLTGELPYNDPDDVRVIQKHLYDPIPSPCEHDASIPPELGDVVRIAMAKRAEDRYQSVADLRAAFMDAMEGPDETLIERIEPAAPMRSSTILPGSRKTYPLRSEDLAKPLSMPVVVRKSGHLNQSGPSPVVQEWQERPRVTGENTTMRMRPRITEDPLTLRRRKRRLPFQLWFLLILLVTTILLALLIVPRALGVSIFPASVPIIGASPVATVYITAQSQDLQDKYLLTASQQVKMPDPTTHSIPSHTIKGAVDSTTTVPATGIKTTPAVQAHGTIELTNTSNADVQIPANLDLKSATGVHFLVLQGQTLAPHQSASAAVVAIAGGAIGNIAAHALDGTCCANNAVSVKNSLPFIGGIDAQSTHVVQQSDLDAVQNAQSGKLQQQIIQQIQKQLSGDELIAGTPAFDTQVSSSLAVNDAGDQVQVTVKIVGTASVYNRALVEQLAGQILQQKADQTLGQHYHVFIRPAITSAPTVAQVKDGVIYLNVSIKGTWIYTLSQQQMSRWIDPIKGGSVAAAQAYLKSQPGISSVSIHLPFGTSQLPTNADNIKIQLTQQ
ncbi:serine/threonine protein kinase [Tengunoibacter tsumagoiensis]|uniref:Protein kinase domain-containing protein n=1 Tax=Tengunoibacter tsumagoiensis TaxID=2014871 RepID=A0A402A1D9_9CHLR|nr:serine/threonine-protein kinase [Tengunoibacter tsumagoiensis]GCE12953.1 hypothetical protein KTT_28120 [Tengunoibacter tsumagoiensis]